MKDSYTYQIRDINGRKFLERESAAEIRHWLLKQPILHYEIWVIDRTPGDIKGIYTATEFIKHEAQKEVRL